MSVNLVSTAGSSASSGVNFNNSISDTITDEVIMNNPNLTAGQLLYINGSRLLRSIAYGTSSVANTIVQRDSNGDIPGLNIDTLEDLTIDSTTPGDGIKIRNTGGSLIANLRNTGIWNLGDYIYLQTTDGYFRLQNILLLNGADDANKFEIQDNAGNTVFNVDTLNDHVIVKSGGGSAFLVQNASSTDLFEVDGSSNQVDSLVPLRSIGDSTGQFRVMTSGLTSLFVSDTTNFLNRSFGIFDVRPTTDNTNAFTVRDQDTNIIFKVDTSDNVVNIGTGTRLQLPDNISGNPSLVFDSDTDSGIGWVSSAFSYIHGGATKFQVGASAMISWIDKDLDLGQNGRRWDNVFAYRGDFRSTGSVVTGAFYRQTTSSSERVLEVISNYSATASTHLYVLSNGDVYNTTGTYAMPSDIRYKTNVSTIPIGSYSDKLLQLDLINFDYIDGSNGSDKMLGFSAQQIQSVFGANTKLVSTITKTKKVYNEEEDKWEDQIDTSIDPNGDQFTVKYSILNLMLHDVVKKQQQLIDTLQTQMSDLIARVEALEG